MGILFGGWANDDWPDNKEFEWKGPYKLVSRLYGEYSPQISVSGPGDNGPLQEQDIITDMESKSLFICKSTKDWPFGPKLVERLVSGLVYERFKYYIIPNEYSKTEPRVVRGDMISVDRWGDMYYVQDIIDGEIFVRHVAHENIERDGTTFKWDKGKYHKVGSINRYE